MLLDELKTFQRDTVETFRKACNMLLSSNYISKDKKDNANIYYFIVNYKKYFDEYFSLIGDELILNQELGCIKLVHPYNASNLRLKKEETFIILILRILYQEHLINTTMNNTVSITIDEIHNKYQSFGFKRKIFKTELVAALRIFKKYNIIDNLGDLTMSATRILIFPAITLMIPVTNIQEVYTYINNLEYNIKEDQNEKVNED